jgi:Flp pilus assembly protein TadG
MTARQRLQQPHAEHGAISVFLAVLVPGLFLVIGFAVDGGAKVAATQRANAIADEAARAGGQALDVSAVLAGQVRVDPAAAAAAAQDYLDRNGVRGVVTVVDGDTLQVTTTITEPTTFLGLIGIDSWTVEGAGTADLVTDPAPPNGGVGA